MMELDFNKTFSSCFKEPKSIESNFMIIEDISDFENQDQTNKAFSEKWSKYDTKADQQKYHELQRQWYLTLYGFQTEENFQSFLKDKCIIFDAGCGLGNKAAWMAQLAPNALVIAMDYSDAARYASIRYKDLKNLFFVRGDISQTTFKDNIMDYTSCDQVIMHTENPENTFKEFSRITKKTDGQVACYFYAKKALPRELLDEHFRTKCKEMSNEQLWDMSSQLMELGKRLSELNIKIEVPDIPALGITGGEYDLQRFLYWNFIKCYWNKDLGVDTSIMCNFDWYSPSNARRFSKEEVLQLVHNSNMEAISFHQEEACYSGRFVHY